MTDTQIKLLESAILSCRSLENMDFCVLPLTEFAKLEQIYLEITGKDALVEATTIDFCRPRNAPSNDENV